MTGASEETSGATAYRFGEAFVSTHRLETVDAGRFASLSSPELRRAASIRDTLARQRFLAGRITVRQLVAKRLGVNERCVTACFECPACSTVNDGSHGWPRYVVDGVEAGIEVSLSREGDWLVVAIMAPTTAVSPIESGPEAGVPMSRYPAIGIDVEDSGNPAFGDAALDSIIASPEEAQALRHYDISERPRLRAILWTRKEAALKATGLGLRLDPSDLDTGSFLSPQIRRGPSAGPFTGAFTVFDVVPADVGLPSSFAVAVAVRGNGLSTVVSR